MSGRRLIGLLIVGLVRVTIATGAMAQDAMAKPSVAIADVSVAPGGWTLPPAQLSSTIIDMMMSELVSTQRFRIYDGQWLVPEGEIGRPNLDRLRSAAADRKVDYVVIGTVTAFSAENKKRRMGGIIPTPLLLGGISRQQAQLHVALTFRIVDVDSGEVVASASGEGIGIRRATGVAVGGLIGRGYPIGAFASPKLPAARDAMLDEAVKQAVKNAAVALAQSATHLEPHR